MTHTLKFACSFAGLDSNARGLLKSLVLALFVLLIVDPVAFGQIDRDDRESPSKFGAVDFPYQAIVGAQSAAVYSGPDEVHYATDELPSGEVVVVYRHDPNGWCAIRPPAGSFSLLPEAAVEKLEDGVGVLIQDQVQAWVGTRLGSVDKPLWQVKLQADEEVEIIGEASWPSPDGHSTIWYQISPPSGEFRWVRIADLKIPSAATRELPADRNLAVDREQARNAFTEVDIEDDYVQKAASFGDRVSRPKTKTKEKQSGRDPSGFAYRSELGKRSVRKDRYAAPNPPELDDESALPARDTTAIDFHFRPIGKTARSKTAGPSPGDLGSSALKHAEANIDRINREQDKVVQATFQSPQPKLAAPGQWRAAANDLKSGVQSVGDRFSSRAAHPNSPDSLLTRTPATRQGNLNDLPAISAPWEGTRGRDIELSNDVPLDFQFPNAGRNLPLGRQYNDSPYVEHTERDYGTAAEEVVVGSAMFSKLSPKLSQLEMALTNEMLKRPNEWQLSDLELTVEQIYSQTNNPVERLQAQRILDKVKNCKKVRSGYAKSFHSTGETFGTSLSPSLRRERTALAGSGGLAAARDRLSRLGQSGHSVGSSTFGSSTRSGSSVAQGLVGTGVDTTVEAGTLYDAHGWLTELVSEDRNNRPVYVLVNDDGKITHHIAPSPGLNLNRYLKSKVGVNGRQGYNNVLKLSHVTVDAVSELIRR